MTRTLRSARWVILCCVLPAVAPHSLRAQTIDYGPMLEEASPAVDAENAPLGQAAGAGAEKEPPIAPRVEPPTAAAAPVESAAVKVPAHESMPLGRSVESALGKKSAESAKAGWTDHWLIRTAGALALVIALAIGARAVARRIGLMTPGIIGSLGPGGRAPSGLLEVLGRYPVARGQTLVLLRLDRRVLLVSQGTGGFAPLCEITDPDDVASILVKARDDDGESQAARFNELLRQVEQDPSLSGDDEMESRPTTPRGAGFGAAFAPGGDEPQGRGGRGAGGRLRGIVA